MKEVSVSLWEVSLEEVLKLPPSVKVLTYYPKDKDYDCVVAFALCLTYKQFSQCGTNYFSRCKYFTFENPEELRGEREDE